ncbi:hypothetical protein KAW48_01360, partial [candidate division WOR-3 bacterium]|nr:hypothetical protein [candidate division WOR-3 bacterium]
RVPPSITVLSPNGGEALAAGSIYTISWSAEGDTIPGYVDLYLIINSDTNYITTSYNTNNLNPWNGSYEWTVPQTPSNNCKIKAVVYDGWGFEGSDESDGVFTIATPPTISIIWPNSQGIVLEEGETYGIRYDVPSATGGLTRVEAYLSEDGGNSWGPTPVTQPQYYDPPLDSVYDDTMDWKVSDPPTSSGRLKLKAYDAVGLAGEKVNNYNFTIKTAKPTNFATEIHQDTTVKLTWEDNSNFNDGYEIRRYNMEGLEEDRWGVYDPNAQQDIDEDVDPSYPGYIYKVAAFKIIGSVWQHSSWAGPDTARFDQAPPYVNITNPGQYRVVYEGPFTVRWNTSDDFGYGISSQKLYYPSQSVNLEGDVRSKEVNFYISGKGSEENIKLEAMDYAVNAGEDVNKVVIIDPSQTNYGLWWTHNDDWEIKITTYIPMGKEGGSKAIINPFNRVYKGEGNNWERIDFNPHGFWWDTDPLGEGQTRSYLVCLDDFDSLSYILTVDRPYDPHPCPVLYTFTGDSFELDNSLLPASEFT